VAERRRAGGVGPAGCGEPDLVLVGGQDDGPEGAGGRKDRDRPVQEPEVLTEPFLVGDPKRRERANQLEPVRLELPEHRVGIGA
jgi:hypothetical protein